MPIGLNEGNVGRSACPGFGKSTYGASLANTSETILETAAAVVIDIDPGYLVLYYKSLRYRFFNVIVFIRATDHVITMLCNVTKNCGWQKHFRFH